MKKLDLLISVLFAAFIFVFGILFIVLPDISFSENENRILAQAPKLTAESILNGSFEKDFETYITDQFPFRDFWVTAHTAVKQSVLNKEINGIYLGKNGFLFEKFEHIDRSRMRKQIEALQKFAERTNAPVYFAAVPTSIAIKGENLPLLAPAETEPTEDDLSSERGYISEFYASEHGKVTDIDILSALDAHKDEYIYYRTDHHWTTLGAYYGYEKICEAMGLDAKKPEDFNIVDVSNSFLGTFYSKGNFLVKPDTISRFDPVSPVAYTVSDDTGKAYSGFYDESYLEKKDKYAYFMSGNPAHLTVGTEAGTGKKLVVIKDSYTHCLLPFFVPHFDEIHMIDPRYVSENLTDLVNGIAPDDILVIFNVKTLSEDTNFVKLGFTPRNS